MCEHARVCVSSMKYSQFTFAANARSCSRVSNYCYLGLAAQLPRACLVRTTDLIMRVFWIRMD